MGSKLDAILNAAKRALGAGEKSFVGNADEQLAKVKVKPATPAATTKPEGLAVVTETRDEAWKAAQARAQQSTGPKANPWDETVPLSPEHQRAAAAVEARLKPGAGGNLQPKPAAGPAAAPPQAPAGMRLEAPKPDKPLTADQRFAQAKARAEGKPDPYGPVSHNTGGLSLQQPAAAKPNPDSAWARAKAAAEGNHFGTPAHSARPGEMGLQAKPDPWREAQERARAADQGQVSMSRLTEAQRQDQAWNAARDNVHGHAPIEMERIDTSRLGGASPVGTSAAPRRPAPGGSGGPGGG